MSKEGYVYLIWELDGGADEVQETFAEIESVSQKEFFAAAQSGLKAQYKIKVWESDYNDQLLVALSPKGKRFHVYRTYAPGDGKIELYLEDKVGGGRGK